MSDHPTRLLRAIIGVALVIPFAACDKEEEIPSWVEVTGYTVTVQPGEGTADHQLTEVYVYTPSAFLGAFPIPGRIPILESGQVTLDFFPGIRANGIKASPDIYPFLARYRTTVDLVPDSTISLQPDFRYDAISRIRFVEDFEGGVKTFQQTLDGRPLEAVAGGFEGQGGLIFLDTLERVAEITTDVIADLPRNGTPVYLEINYRNDAPFLVGIIGEDAGIPNVRQYLVGLNPRDTWNKVYISLTDLVNQTQLTNLRIAIYAALPTTGETESRIWIDNVKLIHS